jgi:hypothetical protein
MNPKSRSRPARGRPASDNAFTPAERMRAMRERKKAAGMKPVLSWIPVKSSPSVYSSHRLLDIRSLAMHAVIAAKIERDNEVLSVARRNLERWGTRWKESPPAWLAEWRKILRRPWKEIASIITETSENATRLRQSSPFAGVLTPFERKRIYDAFRP